MFWLISVVLFVVFLVLMWLIDFKRLRYWERYKKLDDQYKDSCLTDDIYINIISSIENTIAKIVHLSELPKYEFNTGDICFTTSNPRDINQIDKKKLKEKVGRKLFKKFNFTLNNSIWYRVTNGSWVKALINVYMYDIDIHDENNPNSDFGYYTEDIYRVLKPLARDQEYSAVKKYTPLAEEIWKRFSKQN
jgi:hypothetical protein